MLRTLTQIGPFRSVILQLRSVKTYIKHGSPFVRLNANLNLTVPTSGEVYTSKQPSLSSRICCVQSANKTNIQQCIQYSSYKKASKDSLKGPIVYEGNLTSTVKKIKIFSLTTSFITLSLQPLILLRASELPVSLIVAGELFSALFFLTPMLIHWATKGYVLRLHFDKDMKLFTAVTKTFFLREKEIQFKAEDMSTGTPGIFSTVKIKDRNYFIILEDDMFSDPKVFVHLMQYDKPLDITKNKDKESQNKM